MIGPVITTLPHLHVDPRLSFDVAFDQGYPAYGGAVIPTMQTLITDTWAVIERFWPDLS
jgi:hypothetical protein